MAMATNLSELVMAHLTPDVVDRAASYVSESCPATPKALAGIVPTIVAALANFGSTSGGVGQIARMLDSGRYDGSALTNLGTLFGGGAPTEDALGAGRGILETLFGGKLGGVTDLIKRTGTERQACREGKSVV